MGGDFYLLLWRRGTALAVDEEIILNRKPIFTHEITFGF